MQRIEPVIKDYAWGSHRSLAELSGRRTPTDGPEAELWVGAHEAGPALLSDDGTTLDAHIGGDHEHHLGARSRGMFGDRLPFLLKILAAERALSIQAHPDAERAETAEEGVYGDSWPKPEAWIPLTECEAFAGSLPLDVVAPRLGLLGVPALEAMVQDAQDADEPAHALLAAILGVPAADVEAFVSDVIAAVERVLSSGTDVTSSERAALSTVLSVHEQFPGDIGVVVLLTMRHLVMQPGSSYFIHAGVLHAFVRGTTVEILANSDNVVRAGLTPKKVDVAELLKIVDTSVTVEAAEPTQVPAPDGDATVMRFPSAAPHFALWEVRPGTEPTSLPGAGEPGLLLVLDAPVTVNCGDEALELDRLQSAWWPAGDPAATVTGAPGSRVFLASLND